MLFRSPSGIRRLNMSCLRPFDKMWFVHIMQLTDYTQNTQFWPSNIALFLQDIFVHSFRTLSYDRSVASCKASSPQTGASASFLKIQHFVFSLRSCSSCLRLPPLLPVTVLPSIFPSITCFRRQFLRQIWPIQLASSDTYIDS